MDPTLASPEGLPVTSVQRIDDSEYLTLSYRVDLTKADIAYRVQTNAGLGASQWTSAGVDDRILETEGSIELREARVPLESGSGFLRLFVERAMTGPVLDLYDHRSSLSHWRAAARGACDRCW